MQVEITPEPTPAEREAIVRALAETTPGEGRASASEWWRQGLLEGVLEGGEDTLQRTLTA